MAAVTLDGVSTEVMPTGRVRLVLSFSNGQTLKFEGTADTLERIADITARGVAEARAAARNVAVVH